MKRTRKLTLFGTSVAVLGMAKSGIAAANLAHALGARVLVSDQGTCTAAAKSLAAGIVTEFGGHSDHVLQSDLMVKSPGIHQDIPILKRARKRRIPVWSEIELAARLITPRHLIAITGTNGKTTTTVLTGEIFKAAGVATVVAGNIGAPLAGQVAEITPATAVVLEVSSYQLENSPSLRPTVSVVMNITPDHLEHHHTMARYTAAKFQVCSNQQRADFCVLNYDDRRCRSFARKTRAKVLYFSATRTVRSGVYYDGDEIVYRLPGCNGRMAGILQIPGQHNRENALAAAAAALASGVAPAVVERVLAEFSGVEHRIELVRSIAGVSYFNDSKATNVDSTRVALAAFPTPVWLILGGRDKGAPYAPLKQLIREKVRGIFLIGEAAQRIEKELAGTTTFYASGTLRSAVRQASRVAAAGDSILLSPACASFDQFRDFEDRGRQFKEIVRALPARKAAVV